MILHLTLQRNSNNERRIPHSLATSTKVVPQHHGFFHFANKICLPSYLKSVSATLLCHVSHLWHILSWILLCYGGTILSL